MPRIFRNMEYRFTQWSYWSLNVEEHFYALLGLVTLIAIVRGREYYLIGALGLLAVVIHALYIRFPVLGGESFELNTEVVASHLLLSCAYFLFRSKVRYRLPWVLTIAAFVLGVWSYTELAPWYASWLFSPFLFAFAVNHLEELPGPFMVVLRCTPLRMLGTWSYSVYLWQQPFYHYGVKGR